MSDHFIGKNLMSLLSRKSRHLVMNHKRDDFLKFLENIKQEVNVVFDNPTIINEDGSLKPNFMKGGL